MTLTNLLTLQARKQRRRQPRVSSSQALCYLSENRVVMAQADLSVTGLFIETSDPDPIGTVAHIHLAHDGDERLVTCRVVRVNFLSGHRSRPGMGLVFHDLEDGDKEYIKAYVGHLHTSNSTVPGRSSGRQRRGRKSKASSDRFTTSIMTRISKKAAARFSSFPA